MTVTRTSDEPEELQEQYPARGRMRRRGAASIQPERPIDADASHHSRARRRAEFVDPPATRSLRQPTEPSLHARNTTRVATTTGHPGPHSDRAWRVLIAGLITLMAVSGTWTPKLGLDLRGGTTITLTAKNTTGTGAVDPEQSATGQDHHPEPGRQPRGRRVRGHHRR